LSAAVLHDEACLRFFDGPRLVGSGAQACGVSFQAVPKVASIASTFQVRGDQPGMAAKRIERISLSVLVLTATATVALAQNLNTSNPMQSRNTVNPVLSGNTTVLPPRPEAPVSPAFPSGLLNNATTGTNPLTGLPCSGPGSLSVSGAGALPGATSPPVNGATAPANGSTTLQLPPSVFGNITSGAC
jgi:hypothetical protein